MEFSSNYVNTYSTRKAIVPNVIKVKFADLQLEQPFVDTQLRSVCGRCRAVLTSLSHVNDRNIWSCEFCSHDNQLVNRPKTPPQPTCMFKLNENENNNSASSLDSSTSSYTIFCVDLSRSMDKTTKINGKIPRLSIEEVKGEIVKKYPKSKFLLSSSKISRLEAIKGAIYETLKQSEPKQRVGLIGFNDRVIIIGDGQQPPLIVEDIDQIKSIDKQLESVKPFRMIDGKLDPILEKLFSMETSPGTALGPALYASLVIAGRNSGSRVYLCTDGNAKNGVGSMKKFDQKCRDFYMDMANYALDKSTTVSLITFDGADSKISLLGDLAIRTRGTIKIVNPLNLHDAFASLLEEKVIASNVSIRIILPREIYIKNHMDTSTRENFLIKRIGNVKKSDETFYELAWRNGLPMLLNHERELLYQLQLKYCTPEGIECLRVITKGQVPTDDDEKVKQSIDRKIVTSMLISEQAKLLKNGHKIDPLIDLAKEISQMKPERDDDFSNEKFDAAQGLLIDINNSFRGSRKAENYTQRSTLNEINNENESNDLNKNMQIFLSLDDQKASKIHELEDMSSTILIKKKY